ncbi:acetyl-CoA acetyltransferase [Cupriavidus metallidurans]|jgi:acetyl-CoA acetyltransferase|uniref:propanoyl-CoA C-acyltransferase n=1 Tax=Cupriavidus metallidurans (strain ATCC 43123 / DSM 2839 / NBRC 102507 / CH34) TaxID=266264 RepID=Q1LKB7_CUPMC|nr:lipid-transfer protein [Cupriavidus metallidurans]ABF09409.1 Acetyl-CoA C-acyltransferase [Cupriavidus metallidurans CH34]AVA36592.1 lipid-transfer protein [Cupriavidus metallidurans]KWW37409.1 Acetyl-CoA acetyltransferase [Cupriavidus metallidurans]MDE4918934.1 lipid-transfer protein [Cupriavidus metallidurans]QGS29729.1 lipid-transfer protein [Cupriavidus metallidurans]
MSEKVLVGGVGMIPFSKPGASPSYTDMGAEAVRRALADAGIGYEQVQQAYVGYVYGDSTCGQTALYEVGLTGIPVVNVNNNCSTGSTALYLARQAVALGDADCVLALGFEQMQAGALKSHWDDRPKTRARFAHVLQDLTADVADLPQALRTFGGAGREHMQKYGTKMETFAAIRAKASRHAANNPLALFRNVVTTEEVMNDKVMWPGVMTRLMACPPTCGAAAALIVSEKFAKKHGLRTDVQILAQAMATDPVESFDPPSMISYAGFHMAQAAANKVYEKAGVNPKDIRVAELHDCFAHNELLSYEALGLCGIGEGEKFVMDGDNTYGGRVVTNSSGGLLSKGHPLGATGLAQCYELTHQLRGTADKRQVEGAKLALQHNIGLGGACVVTLYGKA